MKSQAKWVFLTVLIIWVAVFILSVASPDLVTGTADDRSHLPVAAFIDWLWGVLATVAVLRATVFRRPNEKGWGQDAAWMWIMLVVGGIWLAATIVALSVPELTTGDDPIVIPYAAIISPIVAVVLTNYAAEFLVEGFAARSGQSPKRV
jgi:hypothetical protein